MFWDKKESEKNDTSVGDEKKTAGRNDELAEMESIINDVLNDGKSNSLREKASERAESLELNKFPKEMSCMTALDELMQCMSLGGQIRNYYRYGDLTLCDKQSEKLNFCFSNSLNTMDVKEVNVQEFYKMRLVEQLKRGSSEDVWESRD